MTIESPMGLFFLIYVYDCISIVTLHETDMLSSFQLVEDDRVSADFHPQPQAGNPKYCIDSEQIIG